MNNWCGIGVVSNIRNLGTKGYSFTLTTPDQQYPVKIPISCWTDKQIALSSGDTAIVSGGRFKTRKGTDGKWYSGIEAQHGNIINYTSGGSSGAGGGTGGDDSGDMEIPF